MEIMNVFTKSNRARYAYQKRMEYLSNLRTHLEAARREGRCAVAANMKKMGIAEDVIVQATGLSREEIEGL